jgi:hypothetical protein
LQRQAADRLRVFADENVGENVAADMESVSASRQRKLLRQREN